MCQGKEKLTKDKKEFEILQSYSFAFSSLCALIGFTEEIDKISVNFGIVYPGKYSLNTANRKKLRKGFEGTIGSIC